MSETPNDPSKSDYPFHVPIAVIIFNRPEKTKQLLRIVRQVQPTQLFVIADGARPNRPGELELCEATRAVFDQVDWDCQVFKNYADENLGCGLRPASGITWVFEHVEEAIILEDDCLPDLSFFPFCQELLTKYRYDQRIMHISGSGYLNEDDPYPFSYLFSRYPMMWGWATWRRAWQYYDFDMKKWDSIQETSFLQDIFNGDSNAIKNWQIIFQSVYETHDDAWDFQWMFACWLQSGLSVLPKVNLITNIGEDGTHTTLDNHPHLFKPSFEMNFPLKHPISMTRNTKVDQRIQTTLFGWYTFSWRNLLWKFSSGRIKRKLEKVLKFKVLNQTLTNVTSAD